MANRRDHFITHVSEAGAGQEKNECCFQLHNIYNKGCLPNCVCEDAGSMSYILFVGVCVILGRICHHKIVFGYFGSVLSKKVLKCG